MDEPRTARRSRLVAGIWAGVAFLLLLPALCAGFLLLIFITVANRRGSSPTSYPALWVVAAIVGLGLSVWLTRLIYLQLRWGRDYEDALDRLPFTASDWTMAVTNFLVMWFVLGIILRPLLMFVGFVRWSPAGAAVTNLLAPAISAVNAVLYLRRQARKRRDALRKKLIEAGLRCMCGYDLTGNVSGVCPECGAPIL